MTACEPTSIINSREFQLTSKLTRIAMETRHKALREEESSWSDMASHRPAPSRCEIDLKICLSFIASVVISTVASIMLLHHLFGPPITAPFAEKQTGCQMQNDDRLTQKFQAEQKYHPHAHLTVSMHRAKEDNESVIVCWQKPKTDIGGGMEYNDSDASLLIPENGFYVIYLQVSYQSIGKGCSDGNVHLNQFVTKLKMGYTKPQNIIATWESVPCKRDVWFKTIHNMARVSLRKGDRLQVRLGLNSVGLIDIAGQPWTKTFWGVFLDRAIN